MVDTGKFFSSIGRFCIKHMQQEKAHLRGFRIDEGGQVCLCADAADVSPVMGNDPPAQVGGAPSGRRMICGKRFSEGGRANSPCHLSSVEKAWQFENRHLDPFAM